jgi:hypothetical protein
VQVSKRRNCNGFFVHKHFMLMEFALQLSNNSLNSCS